MRNLKLKKLMSTVFDVPLESITEDASTDNIENWDSLRHLNLILALEEEFNITIPDEEVGNMVNYKLIEIVINDLLK
ncbi:MAG: acyl carrier protein [Bacteroidetes bacterium]|jgi:acyl carrier protein|nr:acyl carrier protein [Bacteroidota bacterium]MBK9633929.1 acyl carrier protein [Bacteroidota bacterium]